MARKKKERIPLVDSEGGLTHNPFAGLGASSGSTPAGEAMAPDDGGEDPPPRDGGGHGRPARVELRKSKKGRGGRVVTLATWLDGAPDSARLHDLARGMARSLGSGAKAEGDCITIQGDIAERVASFLRSELGQGVTITFGTG